MQKAKSRIVILDGFRGIAIISVMFYHFFSSWLPPRSNVSLYPYNDRYDYFNFGYIGVQFFFIISGFVIFFTLEKTNRFSNFWKKRLIRLVPSMVIASLITFIIFRLFDHSYLFPNSHKLQNFIPSITFITPHFFNKFFYSKVNFNYLNGSYWSLWPEIQFYLLSSVLFYLNRKKFIRNFLLVSIILISIDSVVNNILGSNIFNLTLPDSVLKWYTTWFINIFNLINYLPFFSTGVLFYLLYKNRQLDNKTSLFVKASLGFFLIFILYHGFQLQVRLIYSLILLLFFCFIYYPEKLVFFENKILTSIGVCSYFLYLIHEHIGVFLINSLGSYFLPIGFVFTLFVICMLTFLSYIYTERIEVRLVAGLNKSRAINKAKPEYK